MHFTNTAAITIPDIAAHGRPLSFEHSGGRFNGHHDKGTVKLNTLTHTFPADTDILMVGPGGQNAIIMSDVGGGDDVSGITSRWMTQRP